MEYADLKGQRRSRFDDMWLKKNKCYDIIRNAWMGGGPTRSSENPKLKLNICRSSLIEWSKNEFKNNLIEINKTKQRLRRIGEMNMGPEEEDEDRALKS